DLFAPEPLLADFATTSVTFSARLLAMEYDFVFWADFVDNVTTEDSPSSLSFLFILYLIIMAHNDNYANLAYS
ncbi:hypothetical protein EZS27_029221, partial [termite gut metagenome]